MLVTLTRRCRRGFVALLLACCAVFLEAQTPTASEKVLIETPKPYDRVVAAIRSRGGRVTHQFKYVDAIGAQIPISELSTIRKLVGATNMYKDVDVPRPASVQRTAGRKVRGKQVGPVIVTPTRSSQAMPPSALAAHAASHPDLYSLNNAGTRVDRVHSKGFTGAGVIVAVIDSGIRPGFPLLLSDGSVIGGEDLVGDGLDYSNLQNDPHGTFIAGLISGNASFQLSGALLDAIKANAPKALDPAGNLQLTGAAPDASIYAIRVFGPTGGATLTRIIRAIERTIELRTDYDQGKPGGRKIDVVNLSVGVSSLAAGRTLLDKSVDAVLKAGMIPVVAAGNHGMSSMTISSPGSSMSALTVGAASFAVNERIGTDVDAGLGAGIILRPFAGTQTAWFSSRGPNPDGRPDPDVMASGMVNIGQGFCAVANAACPTEISMASGSSFSAPIAAGVAAILRQAFPGKTATQIRNAIVAAAREGLFDDGSTRLDRGAGMVDALGAYNLLASGAVSGSLPPVDKPDEDVRVNIERNTSLVVRSGSINKLAIRNLKPGERYDILYDVLPGAAQIIVKIDEVTPQLQVSKQNQLYGDGLIVAVHSAKTSAIGVAGDYVGGGFPRGPDLYVMDDDSDTGLMRVTITGDWINAGEVSARVSIASVIEPLPRITAKGTIEHGETLVIPLSIPAKTSVAQFLLSWKKDWSHYPTSDVDIILVDPDGNVIGDGITLGGPERVTVQNPIKGNWLMLIDGFDIPALKDNYKLRVLLDGVLVR